MERVHKVKSSLKSNKMYYPLVRLIRIKRGKAQMVMSRMKMGHNGRNRGH